MNTIKQDIINIKQNILNSFDDPIPENFLKNFVIGGKFIRSTLALTYLKIFNTNITKDIYKILEAGEIIHNASLLHDDVLDNANTRRNETVIAKAFSSKISILAGDFLISKALEQLLEINNSIILEKFRKCTELMSKSEIKQFFLRGEKPSEDNYINICKGKTATLFATILETCAITSNLPSKEAYDFGILFGTYFQIKNDLSTESAQTDKANEIYTALDILGIEKTHNLLDNYRKEMSKIVNDFPENIYKNELKDLIKSI